MLLFAALLMRLELLLLGALLLGAAADPPTAMLSPADPVVGVTSVTIAGAAEPGHEIVDTSTFPDGSVHRFSVTADADGHYADGPFLLRQLGSYYDVIQDQATGAATTLTYAGNGDFAATLEPPTASVIAGAEARFKLTIKSVDGFAGFVTPVLRNGETIEGAVYSLSLPEVGVKADRSGATTLSVVTLHTTPTGQYALVLDAAEGGIVRHAGTITLSVTPPPPDAISAAIHPDNPIVGITPVNITGVTSNGEWVSDSSTFPDGTVHEFFFRSNGAGAYTDGPFMLKQLGTYHDVLVDGGTGGTVAISYQGIGDFGVKTDRPSVTVAASGEAQILVTFPSLGGFAGTVIPKLPDLSILPGATASWLPESVTVRPGAPDSTRLKLHVAPGTPAGPYLIAIAGRNGSVAREAASGLTLTVSAP
jgi:hypothetical protein